MKLRLTVQSGSLAGRQYDLADGSLRLGTSPECEVCFAGPDETMVAPRHATLHAEPDGFYVADNESPAGTWVNGSRVRLAMLRTGDTIRLGDAGPQMGVSLGDSLAEDAVRTARETAQAVFERLGPDRERSYLAVGLSVAFVAWMILLVFVGTIWQVGIVGMFIGSIMAFIPLPLLLLVFLLLDIYDPEPPWTLLGAFGWGALFAIVVSFFFNSLLKMVTGNVFGPGAAGLSSILFAPPVEETAKGLGVLLLFFLLRKEFDGIVDGIVYAGVIALGFAVQENVIYYGRAYNEGHDQSLLFTVFLRGALAPFSHSFFTAMTGAALGFARETYNRTLRIVVPIAGFCGAMFLHMLWNTVATMAKDDLAFIVAYFVVWVPLFFMFLAVVFYLVRREGRAIRRMLEGDAGRGVLTPEEVSRVTSIPQRLKWLAGSGSNFRKLRARIGFLRAASRLALAGWDAERARAAGAVSPSEDLMPAYVAALGKLRPAV